MGEVTVVVEVSFQENMLWVSSSRSMLAKAPYYWSHP